MTKLYLITGFLGAGKTTFLQKLLPLFPDQRIALIVNEFGAAGVDGKLLSRLNASIQEISNGSIFCSCRVEQFEGAVQRLLRTHAPDLIFVEASGLADPSSVRGIFTQPVYRNMEYAGAVCLVDALRFHKVYSSTVVSRKQLAISDVVLINKTDAADREQIDAIREICCAQKPERPVYETSNGECKPEWLDARTLPGGSDGGTSRIPAKDITLSKMSLHVSGLSVDELRAFLKMIAGETYRIKGFVRIEGRDYIVDCVSSLTEVRPYDGETSHAGVLTLLYGKGLHAKRALKDALPWFPEASFELSDGGESS